MEKTETHKEIETMKAKRTFAQWMKAVDDIVWRKVGCSVHDLADFMFRDAYDDGATPAQAAGDVIRENL